MGQDESGERRPESRTILFLVLFSAYSGLTLFGFALQEFFSATTLTASSATYQEAS